MGLEPTRVASKVFETSASTIPPLRHAKISIHNVYRQVKGRITFLNEYEPINQPEGEMQEPQSTPPPQPEPQQVQQQWVPPVPPAAPQPPQKKRWVWPTVIGCGCLTLLFIPFLFAMVIGGIAALSGGGERISGPHVALIHIDGVITADASADSLFGGSSASGSETIVSQLEKARKDSNVKAVVLRINSPGGSPSGSEEVYNEIRFVQKTKPVYTSMGDVAASGGYYIASACDKIYADSSSITGSIGVIMETTNVEGLFKKLGLQANVIKSGKHKDLGSPYRAMTPEERKLLQNMINDTYDQFVTAVSEGRRMPKTRVKELATGLVFTGRQAKNLKLIDEIGGLNETISAAASAGGIMGEPQVERYGRKGGLAGLFDEKSSIQKFTARDYDLIADQVIKRLSESGSSMEGMR